MQICPTGIVTKCIWKSYESSETENTNTSDRAEHL